MSPENDPQLTRNLKRAGAMAGGVLCAILLVGAYTRFVEADDAQELDPRGGGSDGGVDLARRQRQGPGSCSARHAAGLLRCADLFPRARLCACLVQGYRRACEEGRPSGHHRHAGAGPADQPGPRRSWRGGFRAAAVAATAKRWKALLPLDAVSKQDVEEKDQDLASKTGAAKAAQANLDRLLAMKEFARIVAPFDGVVTRRTADIGALVNAGPPPMAIRCLPSRTCTFCASM